MSQHIFWYIARSSGLIGWVLVTASVIWGLALSGKVRPGGVRPAWILDLHRYLGGLSVVFTGVHVAAIVADSYTDFGLSQVLVPFTSTWRPGAIAWGVVAMYLLAAVQITSLIRKHLPRRVWKLVHLTSLPLFAFSTIHLLTAGSEAANSITRAAVWGSSALVLSMLVYRIVSQVGVSATSAKPRAKTEMGRDRYSAIPAHFDECQV